MSMFAKRHYEFLAAFIKGYPHMADDVKQLFTAKLAVELKQENPNFNPDIFMKAAGY